MNFWLLMRDWSYIVSECIDPYHIPNYNDLNDIYIYIQNTQFAPFLYIDVFEEENIYRSLVNVFPHKINDQ